MKNSVRGVFVTRLNSGSNVKRVVQKKRFQLLSILFILTAMSLR